MPTNTVPTHTVPTTAMLDPMADDPVPPPLAAAQRRSAELEAAIQPARPVPGAHR